MSQQDQRAAIEVWEEIVRTAALIRGSGPTLDKIRERVLYDSLTAVDAKAMTEIVSDALILVSLIEQLDRKRPLALE